MDLGFVLVVSILVLGTLIILKVVRKLLKALIGIGFLFFAIVGLILFAVYMDYGNLDGNAQNLLYLLESEGTIIDGFVHSTKTALSGSDLITRIGFSQSSFSEESITQLEEDVLEDIAALYSESLLDDILSDYTRIYVISDSAVPVDSDHTFSDSLQDNLDNSFFVAHYKEDDIMVHPKTMVFRIMHYVPSFILERFVVNDTSS